MSNNSIILKKSSVPDRIPTTTDLQYGELAVNYADGKLYYRTSNNTISYIGSNSLVKSNNLSDITNPGTARTNLGFGSTNIGFGGYKLTSVADPTSAQDGATKAYVDSAIVISQNSGAYTRFLYTTSAGQSQFTAAHTPGNVDVWLDGFKLVRTIDFDDTTSNNYITLTEVVAADSVLEIIAYNTFNVANTYTKAETDAVISSITTSPYSHQYALTGTTTTSTETELFVNGVSGIRVGVPLNKGISYTIDIIGRRTDILGDLVYLTLKGAALNNAGTTTDIGNIYEVIVARTDVNLVADCRADNATDSIKIFVSGVTGKAFSWKAVVTTIEL